MGNFDKLLKVFDENSIENFNFIIIIGNIATKNRSFANNIFLLQFFPFRGGAFHVFPPSWHLWDLRKFPERDTIKVICCKEINAFLREPKADR